jgi:tetratricopeptide (TPR) repeat protein
VNIKFIATLVGLALVLGGCATPPQSASLLKQTPAEFSEPVTLSGIPFFPQDRFQCGPAALATVLAASKVDVTPEQLTPLVYVPEREGSFQVELVAAARSFGRLAYTLRPELNALLEEVRKGTPVLVLQNLGLAAYPKWHYAVVKGFDLERGKLLLNSGELEDYAVSLKTFERTWARGEHWALVVLEPGQVPATAEVLPYFNAVVALELSGHAEAARLAYARGLRKWPHDRNLLMGYGNLLYSNQELKAAADMFREATQHHPAYAPAHNNLAQLLFELGNKEEALVSATKAVMLGGDYSAAYQDTLQMIRAEN